MIRMPRQCVFLTASWFLLKLRMHAGQASMRLGFFRGQNLSPTSIIFKFLSWLHDDVKAASRRKCYTAARRHASQRFPAGPDSCSYRCAALLRRQARPCCNALRTTTTVTRHSSTRVFQTPMRKLTGNDEHENAHGVCKNDRYSE